MYTKTLSIRSLIINSPFRGVRCFSFRIVVTRLHRPLLALYRLRLSAGRPAISSGVVLADTRAQSLSQDYPNPDGGRRA